MAELTADELTTLKALTATRLRQDAEAVIRTTYQADIDKAEQINAVAVTIARDKRNAALAALDA